VKPGQDIKGSEVTTVNVNDLDKQYQEVSKRNQQKILTGHGTDPILFGIKTEGKLGGDTKELIHAHELFINKYAKVEQEPFNEFLQTMCRLRTKVDTKFDIEQIQPIGIELPLDNPVIVAKLDQIDPTIIPKYLANKYGFVLPEVAPGQPAQPAGEVNEHLKNLSGRQLQGLMRYVRKYQKKELSREQASALLKTSFGLSDEQINMFLVDDEPTMMSIQMASNKKEELLLSLIDKYSVDLTDDQILEVQAVKTKPTKLSLKKNFLLAEPLKVSVTELRNAILNQLKGNPLITQEELALNFQIEIQTIQSEIEWLISKGLLDSTPDGFVPTFKGFDKTTGPVETEIYTVYTYEKRDDVAGPAIIPTSRDLCVKLYNKTRKKALLFESIEKLENEFGESVWDYRGGFYNNGTEITPWCRHLWVGTTKIRRK
jgi:hypothetical protein